MGWLTLASHPGPEDHGFQNMDLFEKFLTHFKIEGYGNPRIHECEVEVNFLINTSILGTSAGTAFKKPTTSTIQYMTIKEERKKCPPVLLEVS